MNIKFIGVSELESYMKNEQVQFIDLRRGVEYRKRHIRGAISIPYNLLEDSLGDLSRRKIYVLYCDRGASSVAAADLMQKKGYKCFSLAGGMNRLITQME